VAEERIEVPDETAEADVPEETEVASEPEEQPEPGMEAAAEVEISGPPGDEASQEEDASPEETESEEDAAHGLSGATMETLSRTDEQSLAVAEAEKTKWERRRAQLKERLMEAYRKYMDDGGFKLGISLVTAVIAASIIVITGIFSDRMLSVVFLRAIVGFCVSGIFMGGVLYWLDHVGIPLFISKHEEQLQMEWLSEAEEPEQPEEEAAEPAKEEGEEEAEPGELQELMPQEGENAPEEAENTEAAEEAAPPEERADNSAGEAAEEAEQDATAGQEEEGPQEQTEETQTSGEGMDGIENAVLDDAFSPEETEEEEKEEPPVFAPMTADNLESLEVPEEGDS